jgi:hypothetical protein
MLFDSFFNPLSVHRRTNFPVHSLFTIAISRLFQDNDLPATYTSSSENTPMVTQVAISQGMLQ